MYSSTRHAAGFADAAEIVALEVDEHDVLGAFLGMRHQFGGVAPVLLGDPWRARVPAIGRVEISRPVDAQQPLGRRREDRSCRAAARWRRTAPGSHGAARRRPARRSRRRAARAASAARDSPGRCRPAAMCSCAARTRARNSSAGSSSSDVERQRSGGFRKRMLRRPAVRSRDRAAHARRRIAVLARPRTPCRSASVVHGEVLHAQRERGIRRAPRAAAAGAARFPRPARSPGTRTSRRGTAAACTRRRAGGVASRRYQASRLSRNPPATRLHALPASTCRAHRGTARRAVRRPACCNAPAGPARRCRRTRDSASGRCAASVRSAAPETGTAVMRGARESTRMGKAPRFSP